MFLIRNLKFEVCGVSVEIPEEVGAVLNTEWTDKNSLIFNHKDDRYKFAYEISNKGTYTRKSLVESIREISDERFPIEPIELNGLEGHHSTYCNDSDKEEQYYEARFLAKQRLDGCTEFVFIIWTKNNDIEEIKASPEFKKLLGGIRKKDFTA